MLLIKVKTHLIFLISYKTNYIIMLSKLNYNFLRVKFEVQMNQCEDMFKN